MRTRILPGTDLAISEVRLGTTTWGEQNSERDAHAQLDRAVDLGINFIDTAEMYSVPPKAETYGATEAIIGRWFAKRPDVRQKVVLASKVAGPARGMNWVRGGAPDVTPQAIDRRVAGCNASISAAASAALRYGVSMAICVCWSRREAASSERMRAMRSAASVGR